MPASIVEIDCVKTTPKSLIYIASSINHGSVFWTPAIINTLVHT